MPAIEVNRNSCQCKPIRGVGKKVAEKREIGFPQLYDAPVASSLSRCVLVDAEIRHQGERDAAMNANEQNVKQQKMNGRTTDGRFAKGNAGGPGNPFARRTAELRQVFVDAVTREDLVAIAQALAQRAREGDVAAAKVVLAYVLGKPAPMPHPDGMDMDEFARFKEAAPLLRDLPGIASAPPPDVPLDYLRTLRPLTGEYVRRGPEDTLQPRRECQTMTGCATAPSPNGKNGHFHVACSALGGDPAVADAGDFKELDSLVAELRDQLSPLAGGEEPPRAA
jgi:hypothetical protein